MTKIVDNINGERDMTAEEQAEYDARQTAWENGSAERKLTQIRQLRLEKLVDTDWWVISEQITDAQKTWRQNLRDIPQDYTTEDEYDLLLARDEQGNLTHSVWSKP